MSCFLIGQARSNAKPFRTCPGQVFHEGKGVQNPGFKKHIVESSVRFAVSCWGAVREA